jgi:hypothetical protein
LEEVAEVCTIRDPLVKVFFLVKGDNPAMGFLYEAMDRAKEATRSYHVDKGSHGYEKYMMI